MTSIETLYERLIYALRRDHGIDASEEGGNPLTDSPAVQLLLSVLALADHPGDTAARFHVAHSPLAEPLGLTDYADAEAARRLAEQALKVMPKPKLDNFSHPFADDMWK